ncbi:MAG TPA: DUF3999 domain-containing protein [Rhodocyclaceae bacterium]|nr:DUF3999 domain-containing protein [Rhodocyclaceae bacterium]
MKRLLAVVLLGLGVAWAAESTDKPGDFAYGLPLQTDGRAGLYRLDLPAVVYRGLASRELADLRVFNAAGEVVPYAVQVHTASETPPPQPELRALKIFPLYGATAPLADEFSLKIERNADGEILQLQSRSAPPAAKLHAYLLDARALPQPIRALEFDIQTATSYAAKVRIDAGDDLAHWTTLSDGVPLVALEHGGERLQQRRIEFAAPHRARYFRISWERMPSDARLSAAYGEKAGERIDPPRLWQWATADGAATTTTATAGARGAYDYEFDFAAHYPADRLRLELPQANTVAQIELFARQRRQDPWRPVTRALAYRLQQPGGELTNPDFAVGLHNQRYWRLKVADKGGGLGAGQPRLGLGWRAHRLFFAARGNGPFMLAFGQPKAKPAAYAIDALLAGQRSPKDSADIDIAIAGVAETALDLKQSDQPPAARVIADDGFDFKPWLLWASLIAGVGLLGGMAWSLWRQMGKAE